MKTALKLSILMNLGMLATVIYVLAEGRRSDVPSNRQPVSRQTAISDATPETKFSFPLPAPTSPSEPGRFHWRQLESADYRIYVANLRSIDCPEPTLRDIIRADVDNLYAAKRQQLHLVEWGSGPWSRQEEEQLVASLVGPPAAVETSGETAEAAAGVRPKAPLLPLVFRSVDLDALHFNEGQKAAIAQLRQQFIEQLGGPEANPADPGYYQSWQQAQPEIDDRLRGMIGVSAFQDFQLGAAASPQDDQTTQ